eukprot:CAMPEP_0170487564 /NCGR_PEP_ID=MMETSP0208-20121228/6352_1 /TAXON_ID=197538 /ORGANISM="Strombidium inclinatum, Strain S3" /LENGTH=107 /DNA_ID=CAMNT_0010761889 /DNA_START=400 /DNA_END=723 /DNA_ORIENTATION=-
MSSFELRRDAFFGDIFAKPFSKLGHTLFFLSLVEGLLLTLVIKDQNVLNSFIVDRLALGLIVLEVLVWCLFKLPVIYMAGNPKWGETLHALKKFEARLQRSLCKRKV